MHHGFFVATKALVRNGRGDILLIDSPERGWELPGGTVESGEDLITALQREVREEAGVEIEVGELTGVYSHYTRGPWLLFYFLGRHRSGEPRPTAESRESRWVPEGDVLGLVRAPMIRDRIADTLRYGGRPIHRAFAPGAPGEPYREIAARRI